MMKNELLLVRASQIREGVIKDPALASAVDRAAASGPFVVKPIAWALHTTSHFAWVINLGDTPQPDGPAAIRLLLRRFSGVTVLPILDGDDAVAESLLAVGLERKD